MSRLALLSAVALPVSVISSVYGMNLFVFQQTQLDVLALVLGAMVLLTFGMLRWALVRACRFQVGIRMHTRGMSMDDAVQEIVRCTGTQFDPDVVAAVVRAAQAGRLELVPRVPTYLAPAVG